MRDHRLLTAEEMADRLLAIERPVIVIHTRPDGDTIGSAAALCALYRGFGIDACYASDDEIPDRLRFLIRDVPRLTDLSERVPIAIDVASPTQLGALREPLCDGEAVALMIDHHAVGEPFADHFILPTASSAAEVLYRIIRVLLDDGRLNRLTEPIAAPLYAAISSDTGCFRFSNASPTTLRIAAELVECGVDAAEINRLLFDSKTAEQIRAEGIVAASLIRVPDLPITYAVIDRARRVEAGLSPWDFDTAIDIVRSLADTEVAFVVKENDKGEYKASLRSTGRDVAAVAAAFGGGGHTRAAGCAVPGIHAADAAQALLAEIRKQF